MGSRGARVVLALVLSLAGLGLGRVAGPAHRSPGVLAQTGGSGSGGGNTSTGSSGSGGGENGSSGSGTNDGGGGGGGGDDGTGGGTTPDTVAPPATSAPVPEDDVRAGTPTDCPSDAGDRVRCYRVDPDARGVRVPDGKGGTVVVALPDASPIVDVDTGASTFTSNDVDVEIEVDIDRGEIVGVDQRDRARQAVLATLGLLMLVAAAFAAGALFMRRRGGGPAT